MLAVTAGMFQVSGRIADSVPTEPGFMPALPAAKLRTELPAPEFELINQEGESVSPQLLLGKVVILTAIYSTCPDT